MSAGQRAVFLDRDGTINHDTNYLARPEEVQLLPGAGPAIARLNAAGLLVLVVSNQSGVARGMFSPAEVEAVNAELSRQLAGFGARVDRYYFCPHHPEGEVAPYNRPCDCRKPAPGLLLRAAGELGLALGECFMVGDRPLDMEAGLAAGVTCVLVPTGPHQDPAPEAHQRPRHVAPDLGQAVDWILGRIKREAGA